ncbi:MAG: hypothetical protein HS103_07085 [Anaerolineales bacterium]|nr:hypothetical protein [Anaerolineales bacterium]
MYPSSAFLELRRAALAQLVIFWEVADESHALHPHYLEFRIERNADLPDGTPHNAPYRDVLLGAAGGAARIVLHAEESLEGALAEGTRGVLIYGRGGAAPGMPKRGFPAVVQTFSERLNQGAAAVFEIVFVRVGEWISETWE